MEKHKVLRLSNAESNRLTKECLETAMIKLLAGKTIDRITVTELAKVAGVSRAAFYSNYNSKEDVLHSWADQFIGTLFEFLLKQVEENNYIDMYRHLFRNMLEDTGKTEILIKAGLQPVISETAEKIFLSRLPNPSSGMKFMINGWCGMIGNIIIRWYNEGMRESPEEMASLCFYMTSSYIHILIQPSR